MQIYVLTTFPEMLRSIFSSSILKRAQDKQVVTLQCINLRDFASDTHRTTDDRPYGGGAGMVMKIEPIHKALLSLPKMPSGLTSLTILTSAKGTLFSQRIAHAWSKLDRIILICGHYEGVDERVAKYLADAEVRIGNFVITGGELAAGVMIDAVVRLLPTVLGNQESLVGESHDETLLGGPPVYTRPEVYNDWSVPSVLLQGNHKEISAWNQNNRRPLSE